MHEEFFETGEKAEIMITACEGSITIGSWIRTLVGVKGQAFNGKMATIGHITLSSEGDLLLRVPEKTAVTIQQAQGNITIKHIDGDVTIKSAGADVHLNDVGQAIIDEAVGDVVVENINGRCVITHAQQNLTGRRLQALQAETVGGTAVVEYATGFVDLGDVGGDIALNTIKGDMDVKSGQAQATLTNLGGLNRVKVAGDLHLNGSVAHGEHLFSTKGTLFVDWPSDTPVRLVATAPVVENYLPLFDVAETAVADNLTQLTGHIEDGKPFLSLKAGQHIQLGHKPAQPPQPVRTTTKPQSPADDSVATAVANALTSAAADLDPATAAQLTDPALAEEIAVAINGQLVYLTASAASTPEKPVDSDQGPVHTKGKQAFTKAEKAVEKSLQQAQDSMDQTRQKLTPPPAPPQSPIPNLQPQPANDQPTSPPSKQPNKQTTTTDSRRHILQLLKDDLISIEQADLLLAALNK